MSASHDYVSAASLVCGVVSIDERHSDKISATEVVARLNEEARRLASEEAKHAQIMHGIATLAQEVGLRGPTGDNAEIDDFARCLLQRYSIELQEEQCPF